jgi:large subunit ribosomal protein L18e
VVVNLSRLERYTEKSETVVVPGKVLASGQIKHPITVAAFAYSEKAAEKIGIARGKCVSFADLIKKNPTGANVKILG